MYKGVLKFIKRETLQEEFMVNIGIFNRPSTAERFRKQLQDANTGYDVSFHFQDEQLKKEVFTCEFHTDNDINNILAVLSLTKHFQYKIEGKDVYLSTVK